MVNREIISAKNAFIQKCLARLQERQSINLETFQHNLDLQDIIMHNLQLAIQGCLDICNHLIADNSWEVPGTQADAFKVLATHQVITSTTADIMRRMTGLRNIIIHEYQKIDLTAVHHILTTQLDDFNQYLREIITFCKI